MKPTRPLLITLSLLHLAQAQDGPMVVHEWGTFTSLQDESGEAIGGLNTDDEPLPEFVHTAVDILTWPTELPPSFLSPPAWGFFTVKGIPGLHADVTMRLETPVMYFYPPEGARLPVEMDVRAGFRGGWLTEFYPDAAVDAPDMWVRLPEDVLLPGGIDERTFGSLEWKGLRIGVDGRGPETGQELWLAPRRVSAATVGTPKGEREKYLFYRGVGQVDAMLRVYRSGDGQWLEIRRQPFADPGAFAGEVIGGAWLAHIRGDGSSAFLNIGSLGLGDGTAEVLARVPASFAESDFAPGNLESLRQEMHAALVAEGLFDDEAAAMLDTWREAYFHTPGLRLFFTVPQAWTDHYLPLEFSAPVELTRIMVGRIEVVTPEQRELLAGIASRPGTEFPEAELIRLFYAESGENEESETHRRLRLGEMGLRDLDIEFPESYLDYLDLGRLRNALVLDELGRRPTAHLEAFVQDYRLMSYQPPEVETEAAGSLIFEPDGAVLDDALALDWRVRCENGALVFGLSPDSPVFHGEMATVVAAAPEDPARPWSLTLTPPRTLSSSGLAGVRLAFHPGDLSSASEPEVSLAVNEVPVSLAQTSGSYRLDLSQRAWQVLEVPFTAFAGPDGADALRQVSSIRIEGNLRGTFYLDDLRLVAGVPSGLSTATSVVESWAAVPADFALEQNHPNPFNSQTVLGFSLPRSCDVELAVFNLAGQQVARLVQGRRQAGVHTVHWDGRTEAGDKLASGMYAYRLHTAERTLSRKLLLLR